MKKIFLIIFLLSSVQLVKSQNVMSDQTVFENFVLAINSHDANVLSNYMSDDHVFTDATGLRFEGKEKVKAEWEAYFKMFPDYQIVINSFNNKATVFLAEGTAEATYGGVKNALGDNHFKVQAAWKSVIENGKVKEWQVFSDTKPAYEIINKYFQTATSSDDKVLGIGGVFLKSNDAKALGEWYNKHLGTNFGKEQYMLFEWSERGNPNSKATTTFGMFSEKSKYFDPSTKELMMNFRVKDLHKILDRLKDEGVTLVGEPADYDDFGKFGWIMDLDGNKIELWEPKPDK